MMKSPKDMECIQIDITNACVHRCSNCTRFCGHHRKPFFMDYDTFKKAVDSFDGWDGMVGIIGGEPTLHPDFERFVDYLREKRVGRKVNLSQKPIFDMQSHILKNLYKYPTKIALWSSLNRNYYRHFEVINETFERQLLNDHDNNCLHQAILISRKDMGIDDEEFIKRRDNCFAQNSWSATITPKGAFFCEVAGALDMLFNGPGGWAIEKGWYNRTPEHFEEQLHWCELCSLCLDVPQRIAGDELDDVSPLLLQKLIEIGSPKAIDGKYVLHTRDDVKKGEYKSFSGATDYMDAGGNIRTTKANRNYYPKNFKIIKKEELGEELKRNKSNDWLIVGKNKKIAKLIEHYLCNMVINPGCLYIVNKKYYLFNVLARSVRDYLNSELIDFDILISKYPAEKIVNINLNLFIEYFKNIFNFGANNYEN